LTSADGVTFSTTADVTATTAGNRTTSFAPRGARYVRLEIAKAATRWGVSVWDVRVWGPVDQ